MLLYINFFFFEKFQISITVAGEVQQISLVSEIRNVSLDTLKMQFEPSEIVQIKGKHLEHIMIL